jgi:hypothetical protein
MTFEVDSASTDRNSGKVVSKTFYSEGGDRLVFLKSGPVVENMSVHAQVMVAGIVVGEVRV